MQVAAQCEELYLFLQDNLGQFTAPLNREIIKKERKTQLPLVSGDNLCLVDYMYEWMLRVGISVTGLEGLFLISCIGGCVAPTLEMMPFNFDQFIYRKEQGILPHSLASFYDALGKLYEIPRIRNCLFRNHIFMNVMEAFIIKMAISGNGKKIVWSII